MRLTSKAYIVTISTGLQYEHFESRQFVTADKIRANTWVIKFNKLIDTVKGSGNYEKYMDSGHGRCLFGVSGYSMRTQWHTLKR